MSIFLSKFKLKSSISDIYYKIYFISFICIYLKLLENQPNTSNKWTKSNKIYIINDIEVFIAN